MPDDYLLTWKCDVSYNGTLGVTEEHRDASQPIPSPGDLRIDTQKWIQSILEQPSKFDIFSPRLNNENSWHVKNCRVIDTKRLS